MSDFTLVPRREIIVWLYSLKQLKLIRKHGFIHYISNRLRYVVMYVNADQVDDVVAQLNRYHFVRQVELSYRDDIDMTFKDAIQNRIDKDAVASLKQEEAAQPSLNNLNDDAFMNELKASLSQEVPKPSTLSI